MSFAFFFILKPTLFLYQQFVLNFKKEQLGIYLFFLNYRLSDIQGNIDRRDSTQKLMNQDPQLNHIHLEELSLICHQRLLNRLKLYNETFACNCLCFLCSDENSLSLELNKHLDNKQHLFKNINSSDDSCIDKITISSAVASVESFCVNQFYIFSLCAVIKYFLIFIFHVFLLQ